MCLNSISPRLTLWLLAQVKSFVVLDGASQKMKTTSVILCIICMKSQVAMSGTQAKGRKINERHIYRLFLQW